MSPDPDLLETHFPLPLLYCQPLGAEGSCASSASTPTAPDVPGWRGPTALLGFTAPMPGSNRALPSLHPATKAGRAVAPKSTHICVTEAHGTRLPLAQKQELVVGIDVGRAAILLVPAAHLAGVIRFCNQAAQPHQPLQPKARNMHNPCPPADHAAAQLSTGKAGLCK